MNEGGTIIITFRLFTKKTNFSKLKKKNNKEGLLLRI